MSKQVVEDFLVRVHSDEITHRVRGVTWTDPQGRISCPTGPAETIFHAESGNVLRQAYWQAGLRHREKGPSEISFDDAGRVESERWYFKGLLHRKEIDGPAVRYFESETGRLVEEHYHWRGQRHALNGPSSKYYDSHTGSLIKAVWQRNGEFVCPGHGSIIFYDRTTGIAFEEEFLFGTDADYRADQTAKITRCRNTGDIVAQLVFNGSELVEAQPAGGYPAVDI